MIFGSGLLLLLLPIGVSIHAVILNYDNRVRAGRRAFFPALLAISVVPALFVYGDVAQLFRWPPLPVNLPPAVGSFHGLRLHTHSTIDSAAGSPMPDSPGISHGSGWCPT